MSAEVGVLQGQDTGWACIEEVQDCHPNLFRWSAIAMTETKYGFCGGWESSF